ncbi:MAG: hypothetical protein JNL25_18240 [Rhodospirillaceae bacterium]|nr:hypothetical protein [Rhodospirillaceae bacterium]
MDERTSQREQVLPRKDSWDKLSVLSGFLAAVFVPIAIAVVGHWYTSAIKDRETAISERNQKIREDTFKREWVQLGLEILRDADTSPNVRKWGVQIVSHYAAVEMTDEVKEALAWGDVLPESAKQLYSIEQYMPAQQVVQQMPAQPSQTSRVSEMDNLQNRAIESLLDQDIDAAVAAYDDAYLLWPTFRNVDEIRRLLKEHASADRPLVDWTSIYRSMVGMDLRGVSPDLLDRLRTKAADN